MASAFIQQLTVYADVRAAAQLELIQSCAKRLCPTNFTVIPVGSLGANSDATTPSLSSQTTTSASATRPALAFMKLWEKEREDTVRVVRNNVLFLHQMECFVTSEQSLQSGEVAYALYRRQMPVLALASGAAAAGAARGVASSPATAVQAYLYHERPPSASEEDAITQFFTFPERMGQMLAVEYDGAIGADAAKSFQRVCAALHRQYTEKARGTIVLMGSEGYPVTGSWDAATPAAGEQTLPAPSPAFGHLLQTLAKAHDEGGFYDLMQQSPQLYGALAAFNRYENRGLIRHLLHRGYCPLVLGHTSETAHQLAQVLRHDAAARATTSAAAAFQKHLSSLRRFEGHWADMAVPAHTICLSAKDSAANEEASWLGWLDRVTRDSGRSGEDGTYAVKGPNEEVWDVVPMATDAESTASQVAAIFEGALAKAK